MDLGIYFDSDQYNGTGRTDFDGTQLNGLGADFRIIVGLHGLNAFARWDPNTWNPNTGGYGVWVTEYDPSGFAYLNLPSDTNMLEFGLAWSDMDSPTALRMVSINLWFLSEDSFLADWVPDQGSGYITVKHKDRYIGEGYIGESSKLSRPNQAMTTHENPFK